MTVVRNQRGTALVAALSIAMILLPLGALVALQCRTDFTIQRNLRSDIETFYVAEAGLAHAVAEIAPGQSFGKILAGPDRINGTADDGTFPFAAGPPPAFPYPPYRYDVQVVPSGSTMLRIVSHASGLNNSTKAVDTLVTHSPLPYTPAALYAETSSTNVAMSGSYQVSGIDHQQTLPPTLPAQPAASIAALSTPSAAAEPGLRRDASAAAGQITGANGSPSVALVPRLDLGTCAAGIAAAPAAITHSAATVDDGQWGTRDAPQVSIVSGDLDVRGQLRGSGILLVRGALHVTGTVEFSGLVLVEGAIVFDPSSTVTMVGALWQAASQDERLELRGTGIVAYSSSGLSGPDRAFPGLLPHAVAIVGWQEEL